MANSYFNADGTPVTGSFAASAPIRGEFAAIAAAFDKLPALNSGNASKIVIVNSGGTALDVTAGALNLGGDFTTSGSSPLTLTVTGTTNVTMPTTGTLATVGGNLGTPSAVVLTNATGTASGLSVGLAGTVTTNANLTGVITSVGNATSIASQTGTGTKFVMDTGPTIAGATITGTAALATVTATTVSASTFTVGASNVNVQTSTSYTLQNSDNGLVVTLSNSSAITLTVPSGLTAGFSCFIMQLGAGVVTITPSSTTLRNRNGLKLGGQYAQASIVYIASDTYGVGGDLTT